METITLKQQAKNLLNEYGSKNEALIALNDFIIKNNNEPKMKSVFNVEVYNAIKQEIEKL